MAVSDTELAAVEYHPWTSGCARRHEPDWALAGEMVPALISWEWATARGGKARLDYTQNIRDKTLVGPLDHPHRRAILTPFGFDRHLTHAC